MDPRPDRRPRCGHCWRDRRAGMRDHRLAGRLGKAARQPRRRDAIVHDGQVEGDERRARAPAPEDPRLSFSAL